jgi:hypothetical protein
MKSPAEAGLSLPMNNKRAGNSARQPFAASILRRRFQANIASRTARRRSFHRMHGGRAAAQPHQLELVDARQLLGSPI